MGCTKRHRACHSSCEEYITESQAGDRRTKDETALYNYLRDKDTRVKHYLGRKTKSRKG